MFLKQIRVTVSVKLGVGVKVKVRVRVRVNYTSSPLGQTFGGICVGEPPFRPYYMAQG